ncbi:hypothetical protein D1007_09755 [Hordeum vulgare]|nr:hypothetical protein D1007_09755 [Hordeum vulgare]
MGAMIIKEFLGHRITPLHTHSHPLWEFTGGRDPMCLPINGLTHDELDGALGALFGYDPEDLPRAMPPLYCCDDVKELVSEMPIFDDRGIVGSHWGSSIAVSSLGEDGNDKDSQAIEGEEHACRMPSPHLHPLLRSLGDDVVAHEWR